MSRTYKDSNKLLYSKIRIGKKLKKEAKCNKKRYILEDNSRALKLESANEWNWS